MTLPSDVTGADSAWPLVSVVMPALNAERYIGEALASVFAQTYERLECLVVDDGSTDATIDVVRGFKDDRPNLLSTGGQRSSAGARNLGCRRSSGALVAFLDADDLWHPEKLDRQVELFRRRPTLGIAWCGYVITEPDLRPTVEIRPQRRKRNLESCLLLEANGVAFSSTGIVSRGALDAVGGFDELLSVSADVDFAARVVRHHEADLVTDVLVAYRCHPEQMHLDVVAFEADMRRILENRVPSAGSRRRGLANLATRLFFYRFRRDGIRALKYLLQVGPRIDRPLRLPLEAMGRRTLRWVRRVRCGIPDPRDWYQGSM